MPTADTNIIALKEQAKDKARKLSNIDRDVISNNFSNK